MTLMANIHSSIHISFSDLTLFFFMSDLLFFMILSACLYIWKNATEIKIMILMENYLALCNLIDDMVLHSFWWRWYLNLTKVCALSSRCISSRGAQCGHVNKNTLHHAMCDMYNIIGCSFKIGFSACTGSLILLKSLIRLCNEARDVFVGYVRNYWRAAEHETV